METYIHEVGRDYFSSEDLKELYSNRTLGLIREKVAKILKGVHPEGKSIYVTNEVIKGVLSQLYKNDPANMYIIIDKAIHLISSDIRSEFTTVSQNNNLSVWVQQYGSNDQENKWGLASHPKLKMKERRPTPMIFNMRY